MNHKSLSRGKGSFICATDTAPANDSVAFLLCVNARLGGWAVVGLRKRRSAI